MKNNAKKIVSLMLVLLVTLGALASCGKSESDAAMQVETMVTDSTSGSSNFSPATQEEIGEAAKGDGAEEGTYDVKIIRTAKLSAETKEFEKALEEVEGSVATLGGYVESSDIRGRNYAAQNGNYGTRQAIYTLRIPAKKLDEFLNTAGTLLNVTSSVTAASDISNQYYDIEARLGVLETERQVLEDMLAKASNVSNMITVEERLYDVIYEIESYKTMLKVYDGKVAYSTVTLELYEVADLTVMPAGNSFGDRFKKAVSESWQNFLAFCRDAVIWFIYALPTLIVLALVGGSVCVFITWRKKKRRARKAAQTAKSENNE